MIHVKAFVFTMTALALVVATSPSLLLGYISPAESWQGKLVRALCALLWGYAVGRVFGWYILRRLRRPR